MTSKSGGLNIRNGYSPEIDAALKSLSGSRRPPIPSGGGEGRCRQGRNEQEHLMSRRGRGPSIQRKTRRDNVGKDHAAAGIGDNLQRSVARGYPEATGGVCVWHMSPYERRRGSNDPRIGARPHFGRDNASVEQRDSSAWQFHVEATSGLRARECRTFETRTSCEQTISDWGEFAPSVKPWRLWEGSRMRDHMSWREPDSRNSTVRDRRGASGNVATVEL